MLTKVVQIDKHASSLYIDNYNKRLSQVDLPSFAFRPSLILQNNREKYEIALQKPVWYPINYKGISVQKEDYILFLNLHLTQQYIFKDGLLSKTCLKFILLYFRKTLNRKNDSFYKYICQNAQ